MEIYAAIKGLELLKEPCKVAVYSDSQYLVSAMMEGWVENWKKKNGGAPIKNGLSILIFGRNYQRYVKYTRLLLFG